MHVQCTGKNVTQNSLKYRDIWGKNYHFKSGGKIKKIYIYYTKFPIHIFIFYLELKLLSVGDGPTYLPTEGHSEL